MQEEDRQKTSARPVKKARENLLACFVDVVHMSEYLTLNATRVRALFSEAFFEAYSSGRLNDSKYMLSCTSVFGVRFYHCYHHKYVCISIFLLCMHLCWFFFSLEWCLCVQFLFYILQENVQIPEKLSTKKTNNICVHFAKRHFHLLTILISTSSVSKFIKNIT